MPSRCARVISTRTSQQQRGRFGAKPTPRVATEASGALRPRSDYFPGNQTVEEISVHEKRNEREVLSCFRSFCVLICAVRGYYIVKFARLFRNWT
jgi:hypothetical protein